MENQPEGYQIEGVGIITLEPPTEDLKPFMRRKYKTMFRKNALVKESMVNREDMMKLALQLFGKEKYRGSEQEMATKYVNEVLGNIVLFGRESITEEEFVEEFMSRVYSDPQSRKKWLEEILQMIKFTFEAIDSDGRGFINSKEFGDWFAGHDCSITANEEQTLFKAMDTNEDELISLADFQYGLLYHHLCSGPDSIFSLWFGEVLDGDQNED